MGALIEVVGSSFSGKTFLISNLLERFSDLKVILFEKHFVREDIRIGYRNFYSDISDSLPTEHVISESVYQSRSNPWIRAKFTNPLVILCEPPYKEHFTRAKKYGEKYGITAMWDRIGENSINGIRQDARKNLKDFVLYDGTNFNEIVDKVKEHLDVFGKNNNQ